MAIAPGRQFFGRLADGSAHGRPAVGLRLKPDGKPHRLFHDASRTVINLAATFFNAHGIRFNGRNGVQDLLRQAT
ncbi:hypothetical protein D3C86_1854350 [compost metagenome]